MPATQGRRKIDKLCTRCGHYSYTHDDQGGICNGGLTSFTFTVDQGYIEKAEPWMCGCKGFVSSKAFGVGTIMDVHDRVWSQLMGLNDTPLVEGDRGLWRPSNLGQCLRRQYLWRSAIPETRVETDADAADKERRFAWGRDIEQHVAERIERAGLLIEKGAKLSDPELELVGHVDFVWGGLVSNTLPERSRYWSAPYRWAVQTVREKIAEYVEGPIPITGTEMKSTSSWGIRRMYDEGPRFDYRCQAGAYWLMAQRHPEQLLVPLDRFEIVVVGRDNVRPLRFEASDVEARMAEDRVDVLNEAWKARKVPPCTCATGEVGYDQQKYCPYPNPSGDGCCGSTLLDLLERSVAIAEGAKA
jgi:hypothetical protein